MKFNLLDILLPRETKFFHYLQDQITIFIDGCQQFKTLTENIHKYDEEELKKRTAAIKQCEQKGDEAEHHLIDELHKTFITPLDREDIHTIAINLDRAMDILNSITQKFEIYHIRKVPANVCKFADLLLEMALELRQLFRALEKKEDVMPHVVKLHSMENTGDHLFHWSMAELFDGQHEPVDIIKFKEVYEHLENVTDAVDLVGKLVRGVKVKQG
ncbi:MAG: hypothetical protein A2293_07015 [Elusimicrobia bacterium RIFOXYB2_FULL_49_7]|nr:MAG: hypothetical protein A2293_07015 [Elusimicrobia bacterium RIFOXYB2_FULL_49_7]